jgi:hypothetical protein
MKQKQEVWRFSGPQNGRLMMVGGSNDPSAFCAGAYDSCFELFTHPLIGGISLEHYFRYTRSIRDSRWQIAREIRRQLAAHGVKVEIRRVSK